jgi:hypothetical protein
MRRIFLMAFAMTVALAGPVVADTVITQWNFNSITPGNISTANPNVGVGTASLVGGVTTPTSGSSGAGSSDLGSPNLALQTTTYAAQGTGDKTRGTQFLVSTVGFQNISLNYDLRHSNTSSRYEQVQYTLDGATWNDIQVFDGNAGDTWFNGRSVDFTSISGANNNANFGVRIVPTGTYATSGTWRFDMVTLKGAAVPEPSALGLLAVAGVVAGGLRRKRS